MLQPPKLAQQQLGRHLQNMQHYTYLQQLFATELAATKQLIQSNCNASVPLINKIIEHLLSGDSKLLRPIISFIAAKLSNYAGDHHLHIAAAVEMLHAATLLHDDIVDNASMRRGKISANYRWGNDAAVLAGDFLLAKAADQLAALDNIAIVQSMTKAMCAIAEGEMLQLIHKNNLAITEDTYLQIITAKTATLFAMAATLPTMLSQPATIDAAKISQYGLHLGIAFQLMDDLQDLQQPGGKISADLQEGRITLPLIYLLQHGGSKEYGLVEQALANKAAESWQELQTAIARSGAIAYTVQRAKQALSVASNAIAGFAASPQKEAASAVLNAIMLSD